MSFHSHVSALEQVDKRKAHPLDPIKAAGIEPE